MIRRACSSQDALVKLLEGPCKGEEKKFKKCNLSAQPNAPALLSMAGSKINQNKEQKDAKKRKADELFPSDDEAPEGSRKG